jgi:two-component system, OmpR family, sensor histidine kinase VicK
MATNGRMKQEDEEEEESRIPVAYLILGYENNRNAIIDSLRNAKRSVSSVYDANMPKVASKIDWLEKEILATRKRGVRFKVIAEVTSSNLLYCKKLANRFDELRHLDGIKGMFGVTDTQAVVMVPSFLPIEEHNIQFIVSDSESLVSYKQQIFDMLWMRAMPAESRFEIGRKE